jgi:hypothetical protein
VGGPWQAMPTIFGIALEWAGLSGPTKFEAPPTSGFGDIDLRKVTFFKVISRSPGGSPARWISPPTRTLHPEVISRGDGEEISKIYRRVSGVAGAPIFFPKFSKIPGGTPLPPTPVNFGGVTEVGEERRGKIKLGPAHFRFGQKSRSDFELWPPKTRPP